ncbi:flagellar basal body L-ring protein FlgH [Chromobacterium piscinae]|uniref:Flagellar L-ring protein n=1 Tax=Chromobacterium piscinae TaxID=686831 RepID=A0ABV0H6H3_9NEIS|nr:flagellar basal body L-ring protein FlgH [Chromobacterium piscinae]MBX9298621.1 flagellar basal body L-ring protein FlgH [Chromobacterium vaccinii]MBX9347668.1 flagellar basal body L-ring protein FlgH [Chromobacterium vaccinii]MBX9357526.1 flagellar basal body L-ring protein FlgH [Chromobacterium vaccinii]MCD5328689.1 flagellar basal body L-ring protein FlgH [Chromobacterium piscinae]NHQ80690.1 flagellar basal body L-ring protein FlgH [Chromobacterium vaccinii]
MTLTRLAPLAALLLAACAQFQPPPPEPDPLPELMRQQTSRPIGGGVFTSGGSLSLTSDNRAFRPGDVLTVVLEETTQASKQAGTSFGKKSGAKIGPSLIGNTTFNAQVGIDANRDFNGSSSSTQQNALAGSLTVVVHKVLPNGLLQVKGEKQLALNQGEEMLRLAGYVRVEDIDTDNRVSSLRIANARIGYSGSGALADANSPGWLMRFFASPLMPF